MIWCRDAGLESRLRAYFGDNITAAHLKMAEAPQGDLSRNHIAVLLLRVAGMLTTSAFGAASVSCACQEHNGSSCQAFSADNTESVMTGACTIIDYLRDDGSKSPFPLIRCENIFVLPGVPDLLQAKWKVIYDTHCCWTQP